MLMMKTSKEVVLVIAVTFAYCLALVGPLAAIRTASAQSNEHQSEPVTNTGSTENCFLHSDIYELDSSASKTKMDEYESFLGRTSRQSRAWSELARANAFWRQSAFAEAIAAWKRIASDYSDTDAAYAALSNVALGCKQLGDEHSMVESQQLLLLLPQPTLKDRGMEYNNYRHDACVGLADHYEAKGLIGLAYQFLSRALDVDERHEMCGTYRSWVVSDLMKRRARLKETLVMNQGK
jgi:hypothetical protein